MKPKILRNLAIGLALVAVVVLIPGSSLFAATSADEAGLSNGAQGRATVDPNGYV